MLRDRGVLAGVRAIDRVRVDRLLALVLLVAIELQVWLSGSIRDRLLAALVGLLLALAVAVRRRWPLAAPFAVVAFMFARILSGGAANVEHVGGVTVAVIALFYGLGAFAPEGRSEWMLALAVIVTSTNALTKPGGGVSSLVPMELFGVLLPYACGRTMRARAGRERVSRDAAERLDATRESTARAAAYGERARIARELHDVIAHSVSVMVIHAGGARLVMGEEPERAEESLRSVERAGREALAEMRRLLGVLGDGDPRALAPQPGLADGRLHPAVNGTCGGHGILGMRERVALHSGTLQAGACPDGGFTVRARLPLAPEHES